MRARGLRSRHDMLPRSTASRERGSLVFLGQWDPNHFCERFLIEKLSLWKHPQFQLLGLYWLPSPDLHTEQLPPEGALPTSVSIRSGWLSFQWTSQEWFVYRWLLPPGKVPVPCGLTCCMWASPSVCKMWKVRRALITESSGMAWGCVFSLV